MALGLIIFSIQGCSVIGACVGAAIDHREPDVYSIHKERANEVLTKDQEINVKLENNSAISGFLLHASVAIDTLYNDAEDSGSLQKKRIQVRLNSLSVNSYGRRVDIPGDSITAVLVKNNKSAMRTGIIVGLACDALLATIYLVAVIQGASSMQ
jgi:hypothetical protein